MSKQKPNAKPTPAPQSESSEASAGINAANPAHNGQLPHATKKVSLGPNTKR